MLREDQRKRPAITPCSGSAASNCAVTTHQSLFFCVGNRVSDHHQMKRGTVQHEILESAKEISAYQDGEELLLHISCKPDATQQLDELIPYSLAVTLEVKEDVQIPIYQQIRAKIQQKVQVTTPVRIKL